MRLAMGKGAPLAVATVVLFVGTLGACDDDSDPVDRLEGRGSSSVRATKGDPGFGWSRPSKQLSGHPLKDIVHDARISVRADDRACVGCHEWAKQESRASFCDRIPIFVEQPTSTGRDDDPGAKPQSLKDVLDRWYEAGCPE